MQTTSGILSLSGVVGAVLLVGVAHTREGGAVPFELHKGPMILHTVSSTYVYQLRSAWTSLSLFVVVSFFEFVVDCAER